MAEYYLGNGYATGLKFQATEDEAIAKCVSSSRDMNTKVWLYKHNGVELGHTEKRDYPYCSIWEFQRIMPRKFRVDVTETNTVSVEIEVPAGVTPADHIIETLATNAIQNGMGYYGNTSYKINNKKEIK